MPPAAEPPRTATGPERAQGGPTPRSGTGRRPERPGSVRRRWAGPTVVIAAAVTFQLLAGPAPTDALRDGSAPAAPATTARARPVPVPVEERAGPGRAAPQSDGPSAGTARATDVERLLQQRASALLRRDRDAFLAVVDPASTELRRRQEQVFDALASVPIGSWSYTLDRHSSPRGDVRLDRRYGAGRWWAPDVSLAYALEGFDRRPVHLDLHLTFSNRSGRWLLAADDDFAEQGRDSARAFWDRGPVVAVRDRGVLVLGRPGAEELLREVAGTTATALPRVSAVWGPWPERVVVLVPKDADEMAAMLGGHSDLSRIAAVATAELRGGDGQYDPTGDRVLVNPDTFSGLGRLGRSVVLTHEATHVATRRDSGPAVPAWLAEGFADHVAYRDVGLPPSAVAQRLAAEVRAGAVPVSLPGDEQFEGTSSRLSQAYEGSWLAVRLLAAQHGDDGLLRLYRSVGSARGVPAERALEDALQRELGTTTARLTADWRAALTQQLG